MRVTEEVQCYESFTASMSYKSQIVKKEKLEMKRLLFLFVFASLMVLAACGSKPQTAEELLDSAIEANEELDSYSFEMMMEAESMGTTMKIEATGDVTYEPNVMHMKMSMGLIGITLDVETYITDDDMYMQMFGEWIRIEEDEVELDAIDEMVSDQLDDLDEFINEFEFKEEDDAYVLTLTSSGEEFIDYLESYLSTLEMGADADLLDDDFASTVNSIDMEMKFDKETFLLTSQTIDMEFDEDGETLDAHVEIMLSNMNEIDPIEIPEEVKENAVSEDLFTDDLFGGFLDDDFDWDEEDDWMTLEEMEEAVGYVIPEVTDIPENYEMIDYYHEPFYDAVVLEYIKDFDNQFMLSVYPSIDAYGEIPMDAETVDVDGTEGTIVRGDDDFILILWEFEDVFLELIGFGPEMTDEFLLKIAESVE